MGLVDDDVHSPRVPAGRESPKFGGVDRRPGGVRAALRHPCSEFEHIVAHGRHRLARDDRSWQEPFR